MARPSDNEVRRALEICPRFSAGALDASWLVAQPAFDETEARADAERTLMMASSKPETSGEGGSARDEDAGKSDNDTDLTDDDSDRFPVGRAPLLRGVSRRWPPTTDCRSPFGYHPNALRPLSDRRSPEGPPE